MKMKRYAALAALAIALTSAPAAAQLNIVQEERAKVTAPPPIGNVESFEITKRVARRIPGAGVLVKTAGNNQDGFAVDIVCLSDGTIVDILTDAGGVSGASWSVLGPAPNTCVPPPGSSTTTPPPPPPPPNVDLAAVIVKLDHLQATVDALAALADAVHGDTSATRDAIEELKTRPVVLPPFEFPEYSGRVLGQSFTLHPKK